MSYVALYRKFRPDNFEDVKGQDHIVTTLKNQIKASRIGHAYLFCGTRGTGKTTIAKIFARSVNCENPVDGNPCMSCPTCKAIAAGVSMNVIEIDAASNNGVDNIREIIDEVSYSPAEGKYKVYIIDEVHMLSGGAFNALLKTLEEPPSYVIFILATTEPQKLPITILSRCQRYDFRRISIDTIKDRLLELMNEENVKVEEKALRYVAKAADGSLRDALSLLDQCIAFHIGEELTYDKVLDVLGAVDTGVFNELLSCIIEKNVIGCIDLLDRVIQKGREITTFVSDFVWYLRNLLLVKTSENPSEVVDTTTENMAILREEAKALDTETIIRYIRVCSELTNQLRYATQKRIMTEVTFIKLCRPQMEKTKDTVLDRLKVLEDKIESGAFVSHEAVLRPAETPDKPEEEKVPLPIALPEEIKEAVSRWNEIKHACANPFRSYLQNGKLSCGQGNELLVVFSYGTVPLYFLEGGEYEEKLADIISGIIGKTVKVSFVEQKEGVRFNEEYADIGKLVTMNVEVEDDEDESSEDFF